MPFYLYGLMPFNVVQYNIILHTSLQALRQDINQGLNTQKPPHTSPWWVNYRRCLCDYFRANWLHYNGTAMYTNCHYSDKAVSWPFYPYHATTKVDGFHSEMCPWWGISPTNYCAEDRSFIIFAYQFVIQNFCGKKDIILKINV